MPSCAARPPWPTRARTRTAAIPSSSPRTPRPGSTASTPRSARLRPARTWSTRSAASTATPATGRRRRSRWRPSPSPSSGWARNNGVRPRCCSPLDRLLRKGAALGDGLRERVLGARRHRVERVHVRELRERAILAHHEGVEEELERLLALGEVELEPDARQLV